MGVAETSSIMWRQRELLATLLFKLQVESLLLAAGRCRWLGLATSEVALALEQVRAVELLRSIEVDALAREVGLPPAPTLAELVGALDPPWDEVFAEHRDGLVTIAAEIAAAARSNRRLLVAGQLAVAQAMQAIDDPSCDAAEPVAGSPSPGAAGEGEQGGPPERGGAEQAGTGHGR